MTMPQTISDELYRDFLKTLQSFHDPAALTESPLRARSLIQQAQAQSTDQLPHLTLKAVFTEILDLLDAENHDQADLLRGRFWEGMQIEEMLNAERPLVMGKRTFSNYQRSAIQAFAFLFLQVEASKAAQTVDVDGTDLTVGTQDIRPAVAISTGTIPEQTKQIEADEPVAATEQIPAEEISDHLVYVMGTTSSKAVVPYRMLKRWRWVWAGGGILMLLLVTGFVFWRMTTMPTQILFADDFEAGTEQWRVDSDAWTVRTEASGNNVYCVKTAGDYTYALAGSTAWRDYVLDMDLRILSAPQNGSGNILWRVSGNFLPFYLVDFFANSVSGAVLAKEVPEYETLDQSIQGFLEDTWVHARIEVQGPNMAIFVGDEVQPMLQATDPNPLEQGGIGLGAGFIPGESDGVWEICFDNVRVTAR